MIDQESSSRFGHFPNLFSIGGMRCGSTMLYENLSQHPQVFFPEIKEPDFLLKQYWRDELQSGALSDEQITHAKAVTSKGKIQTMDQYLQMYESCEASIRGDGSHYLYHPCVIDLIKRYADRPKILISFRDPIDRLFSEFMYMVRIGRFEGNFKEFVAKGFESKEQGKKSFGLEKGLYFKLLKPWFDAFDENELRIVIFEELSKDAKNSLSDICEWLEIDPSFDYSVAHPEKSGRPTKTGKTITSALRSMRFAKWIFPKGFRNRIRRWLVDRFVVRDSREVTVEDSLREFYRSDVEEFRELIGRQLPGWKTLS